MQSNQPNNRKRGRSRSVVAQANNPAPRLRVASSPGAAPSIQRSGAPLAISSAIRSSKPREMVTRNGGRVITFREYVQDIAGSAAFAVSKFPVQPGLPTLFAWLANQAANYQEYRFLGLKFIYETEKSASTSGKVMYAFNPDAGDAAPASKQEMLEFENKAADVLWRPFVLPIPVRPIEALGAKRYVRSGTLASNLDIKTYDLGNLWVATQGMADTTAVGELFVEYSVLLESPVVSAALLAFNNSADIIGASPSAASYFGTTPTVAGGLDISVTGNTITFNRVGRYIITSYALGTGLHTSYEPTVSGTAAYTLWTGFSNAAADAGTGAVWSGTVIVTQRGQTIIVDADPVSTTVTGSGMRIAPFALTAS